MTVTLTFADYAIIGLYFIFAIAVGFAMKGRGGKGLRSYYLSDGRLPWWILGTSMVATTFSLPTPLLVAGWVREVGIAKNWEWWVFLTGQMFTTFFFAKLWRRTNVLNDAEFIHLRYSGKEAAVLRGFRALYMGFIINILVIGQGFVAVTKFGTILFGVDRSDPDYDTWKWGIVLVCGFTALFYTALSGFSAIVITDFVQFILAMMGAVLIAMYVCRQPEVGGLEGLVEGIATTSPDRLAFFPDSGSAKAGVLSLWTVIVYASMRWWAQVYGGAEPGGQSHVAQRMLAAKSEKDALLATLWFNVAHYVVRPLPWIIAGLGTLLIFPLERYTDHERVYLAAINFVPAGLKGLVVASLLAAFMSTIDTRLNLGASYFVNDFYRPFLVRNKPETHYVLVSRWVTGLQLMVSFSILFIADDVRTLFFIITGIGSGAGLVYILRFYWWRVSAWSEMAAMSGALIVLIVFRWGVYGSEAAFNNHALEYLVYSLFIVTTLWLVATFIAPPCDKEVLKNFFRKVRPAGPLWKPISTEIAKEEGIVASDNLKIAFVGWIFSNPMTLGYLFGVGNILLGNPTTGLLWLLVAAACTVPTLWAIHRLTESS